MRGHGQLHPHLSPLLLLPAFEGGEEVHVVAVADPPEVLLVKYAIPDQLEQLDEDISAWYLEQKAMMAMTESGLCSLL